MPSLDAKNTVLTLLQTSAAREGSVVDDDSLGWALQLLLLFRGSCSPLGPWNDVDCKETLRLSKAHSTFKKKIENLSSRTLCDKICKYYLKCNQVCLHTSLLHHSVHSFPRSQRLTIAQCCSSLLKEPVFGGVVTGSTPSLFLLHVDACHLTGQTCWLSDSPRLCNILFGIYVWEKRKWEMLHVVRAKSSQLFLPKLCRPTSNYKLYSTYFCKINNHAFTVTEICRGRLTFHADIRSGFTTAL